MTTPPAPEDQAALFGRLAREYDETIRRYQPTYDAMIRLSTDLACVAAPGRVRCLDFGTGTGAAIPLLAPSFDEIVAIEPAPPMLAVARSRASAEAFGTRVTFIQGTIHAEQAKALAPGSFDAVHCSLVLMFVEQDTDKLAVLEFFHRLLRPAGAVVLTDIVNATSPHTDKETFARWTALMRHRGADDAFVAAADRQIHTLMHRRTVAQLTSLLTQAGFRTVEQPFQALHTAMLVATK